MKFAIDKNFLPRTCGVRSNKHFLNYFPGGLGGKGMEPATDFGGSGGRTGIGFGSCDAKEREGGGGAIGDFAGGFGIPNSITAGFEIGFGGSELSEANLSVDFVMKSGAFAIGRVAESVCIKTGIGGGT
jgi:hypothetical protein